MAYFTFRGLKKELWGVTVQDRFPSRILELPGEAGPTSLSSDGRFLAYSIELPGRGPATWVAPLDGGPPRRVTAPEVSATYPCWSRDGRTLAVEVLRPPDMVLATVPASGGPLTVLVGEKGLSWPYDFSPDGERISFVGERGGVWNVYWVSRKDGAIRRLTENALRRTFLRYPAWSPQGDRIVYEQAESTGNIWLLPPPR